MLRYAEEEGITDVVNTVHFQHPKMIDKNTDFDYISSIRNQLEDELSNQNISINIHLGSEVFFNFNLLEILDNPLNTFCNGKYMLIEFQTIIMPHRYENHLYDLKMEGITPIIAHPERYKTIQNDISVINSLINSGCLIQIDAGSIIGHFGKVCQKTAKLLFSRNMVHMIGSDAHNKGRRNFCLHKAIDILSSDKMNMNNLYTILNNPNKVIAGEDIYPFETIDPIDKSLFKKFFSFFK